MRSLGSSVYFSASAVKIGVNIPAGQCPDVDVGRVRVEVFVSGPDLFLEVSRAPSAVINTDFEEWGIIKVVKGFMSMEVVELENLRLRLDEVRAGLAPHEALERDVASTKSTLDQIRALIGQEEQRLAGMRTARKIAGVE
jgi:hypothetical protein